MVKIILELSKTALDIKNIKQAANGRNIQFDAKKMHDFIGKEEIKLEYGLLKEIEYFKTKYNNEINT